MSDKKRCGWRNDDPVYTKYHDEEWGKLVVDDKKMFEFLILESAQAGLSWITILKRRDGYRKAFVNYDVAKVSKFGSEKVEELLKDKNIIRNRMKIEAAINNAKRFIETQREFGSFCDYLKTFLPNGKPIINNWTRLDQLPARTELSDRIAKDMKKRGFKFFGSVICYAHLQATGYVNDHLADCEFKK
ncbi:MAG: DNA-3-methyladenine glycosylase I [Rickettsiales bacterium]|jgi:DNA-3-methyladenine glycosylase I|nr:DNA-3-methyladenine glycosylase I [Rickettsiales bacterium]